MPMRRGNADPRDPGSRSPRDGGYGGPNDSGLGSPRASGRRPAARARWNDAPRSSDSEVEFGPRLTLPTTPRMPRVRVRDARPEISNTGMPAYHNQVPLREPSILVPGKDSGKLATTRQSARMPSVRGESRARVPASPRRAATDDWELVEQWEAAHGWDEPDPIPSRRALASPSAAYAPQPAPMRRMGTATRALARRARSKWWTTRYVLALVAAIASLSTTFAAAGQPAEAHQTFQASASSKALEIVAQQVRPLTSLLHPEQYDSKAQFDTYSGAACSPSVLAEVLTAWGLPDATIGHMIDDLGPDLSPYGGLLTQDGFQVVAAKHAMRADISWNMTYDQMLYLTNVLGIPVIVNFHRSWGYYHFFDGGHFLVVTGGDQNGVTIVDSSEYFIKYLPRETFDGLWQWKGDGTAMTVVVVPQTYKYTLPHA